MNMNLRCVESVDTPFLCAMGNGASGMIVYA